MKTQNQSEIEALRLKSKAYLRSDSFSSVLELLSFLSPDCPRQYAILFSFRGLARYHLEEYREAIDDFSIAINWWKRAENNIFMRGRCFEELESFTRAIADYDRVIEIAPETADAHAHRGFCLENLGQFPQAKRAYTQALLIDPNETLALAGMKELAKLGSNP